MPTTPEPRVVLTHHWLVRRRGGERVLEALRDLFPGAPVYTLVESRAYTRQHPPGPAWGPVGSSWLAKVPGAPRIYPYLLPLMPSAAASLRLPECDLVVCSDAGLAKAIPPPVGARMLCYCHSPMRYVWEPEIERAYVRRLPAPLRPLWPALARKVRQADLRAANHVDRFVANSAHVARRIRLAYGRDADVVHPPVELPPTPHAGPRADFYLCVGHHVPYKRLDLAVDATRALSRPLVVIGEGPDVRLLQADRHRTAHVRWLQRVSDAVLHSYYEQARGLLFPGEEDFGIVPVEAMSRGCPVIAYRVGGALETVSAVGGVFFEEQTPESLADAILASERRDYDRVRMHADMQRFHPDRFKAEMRRIIDELMASPRPTRLNRSADGSTAARGRQSTE